MEVNNRWLKKISIKNSIVFCYGKKTNEIIELEKLKEWPIENQSSYCLNGFYSVTEDNKIYGINFL